ncbi:hypothetical protein [Mesorhizobium sp. M0778]|uniref:hypothetical protein n=1 Tax=Mesorhizobium sp. M0778 TaxID=2956999 RepID=UPI003339E6C5
MPNTPVRAAAEGLPAISRRTILVGLGAATATAVTLGKAESTALTKAGGFQERKESPMNMINHRSHFECADAELFRLDKELEEAHARMERAAKVCRKVGRRCEKLYPPRAPEWKEPDMPEDVRAVFNSMTIEDMALNNRPAIYAAWSKEIKEQKAANKALHDACHVKWEEINREGGVDAAEEAFNAICQEEWEIGMRICAVPAHTLEGMKVKLRVSDMLGLAKFADPNEAFLSIAADIRRLAGEA